MHFLQTMTTIWVNGLMALALGLLSLNLAAAQTPAIVSDVALADMPLATTFGQSTTNTLENERDIQLGGFSDLVRRREDPTGVFWIVTDRGPNGTVKVDGKKRRTFPAPDFAPAILKVKIDDQKLTLLDALPLVGQSGKPIGGLPNLVDHDGKAFDFAGRDEIEGNPSGVDAEGLACAADGGFWVAEEYRPSLLRIDASGKVIRRLVPRGTKFANADYDVVESLPAIYSHRQDNRGFEGLALSPDGKLLYVAIQSPLANPNKKIGEQSRHVRILCIDTETEKPVAEYVYPFDAANEFDADAKPDDMKIGALVTVGSDQLLVLERVDRSGKVYSVRLADATNLLTSPHHDDRGNRAVETLDLASHGIKPLPKTIVADLSGVPNIPQKLEGMALVDQQTIAVVNDNDFGFSDFDASGKAIPSGVKSRLILLRLARPLQ